MVADILQKKRHFMARSLRLQFEGALYHLVVRANNRQPLFRDDRDRRRYLELLRRYRDRFRCRVYAYILTSRCVHLLLETPRGNVSKIMQCLGTSYASYFNRRHRRRGAVFEGRYKSYLVDKHNHLPEITRTIHRTPGGSSLEKKRDDLWSSYRIYLGRGVSDLVEVQPVLSWFGGEVKQQRGRYQEFVERYSVTKRTYEGKVDSQNVMPFQRRTLPLEERDNSLSLAESILREVSVSLGLSEARALQKRKKSALARHVAMYLIRRETNLPLRSIGELLGVKAPAVALGIGKVEELLKREDLPGEVRDLLKMSPGVPADRVAEYPPSQRGLTGESGIA